jgi:hypothetical protein
VRYLPWNTALAHSMKSLRSLVLLHDDDYVTVYALELPTGDTWASAR